jgi:hypothetical protein
MRIYQQGRFIFITEGLLIALILTFLGWQSWNTKSDIDREISPTEATARP